MRMLDSAPVVLLHAVMGLDALWCQDTTDPLSTARCPRELCPLWFLAPA